MKIDMSCFKSFKKEHAVVTVLSALLVLFLVSCDGGMIGTGSGPTSMTYELENLPARISPDIPETLSNSRSATASGNQKESVSSFRNQDAELNKSQGWEELNFELSFVAIPRVRILVYSTIVDLVFDDILNECAEQLLNCTIPALIGTGFESLLNEVLVIGETSYSQLDGAPYDHFIRTTITSDAGKSEGVFSLFQDSQIFSAQWHEDGQVAKYTIDETFTKLDEPITLFWEYFYQNNVPSELVVSYITFINEDDGSETGRYTKILGNDPNQAGVLVEASSISNTYSATSGGTASISVNVAVNAAEGAEPIVDQPNGSTAVGITEPVDVTDSDAIEGISVEQTESTTSVTRAYRVFRGQLDNSGGYSTLDARDFNLPEQQTRTYFESYREAYDTVGKLLAGEGCEIDDLFPGFVNPVFSDCDENNFQSYGPEGSQVTDNVLYFANEDFDSLAALQDSVRWKVEGVPGERASIAVVSAASQTDLLNAELLCRGIQYVVGDAHIFCAATDEQLDNTAVVELIDGVPTRVIPEARLVQIQ